MKTSLLPLLISTLPPLTLGCRPDTRPYEIRSLRTVRGPSSQATTISFIAARSDGTTTPITCIRREDPLVNNDTFFSPCSVEGFQWQTVNYTAGSPPHFGILLQLNAICPPEEGVTTFSWKTVDVGQFMGCQKETTGAEVCAQITRNIILAEFQG